MTIQIPVYGSDESVTMTPYELTFPICVVEQGNSITTYKMLDETECTFIHNYQDGSINVCFVPHDFVDVLDENITKEEFFASEYLQYAFYDNSYEKVELSEIENLLKRFAVLLHNKIDQISTNVKPF